MNTSRKICPFCNHENENTASACTQCGELLEEHHTRVVPIPENLGGPVIAPARNVDSFIDLDLIPENGIGIHVAGGFKPYYVAINKELILGREANATSESVLDLSELGAFGMGVSKRHAMIRRNGSGYDVIDLSSRNGTWLNAERLVPNKPYSFPSGSQLRMGQMRLLIVYPTDPS